MGFKELPSAAEIAFIPRLLHGHHVGGVEIGFGRFSTVGLELAKPVDTERGNGCRKGDGDEGENGDGREAGDNGAPAAPAPAAFGQTGRAGVNGFIAKKPFQFIGEFVSGCITSGGFLLQALESDGFQVLW